MFDDYFEIFLADTKESREIHYNIRYQVYCEELGYEDTTQFPDMQEYDKWDPAGDDDDSSILFLVRLKHTQQWIGAMRIVHHDGHMLPLQEITSLDHDVDRSAVEVSRLCLVKEIRKPFYQNAYGIDDVNFSNKLLDKVDEQNVKSFYTNPKVKKTIIWGIFHAAMQYSISKNIEKCYLLTSKALSRVLKSNGVVFEKVGPSCEHRGERAPYLLDVKKCQENPIWNVFNKSYRLYSELIPLDKALSEAA